MKIIAFKRANHPSLHPEFITEYIDAELLKSTDGYETMVEEHFQLELSKNSERHEAHQEQLKQQAQMAKEAERDAEIIEQKIQKEIEREFKHFQAWRKHSGKK